MEQVRIYGDPFGDDVVACRVRSFLEFAADAGLKCSLALDRVASRPVRDGQRVITLTDGARQWSVGTDLATEPIARVLAAAGEVVASTAPVLVFAAAGSLEDAVRTAGFEWPEACEVIAADEHASEEELVARLAAAVGHAGSAAGIPVDDHVMDEASLRRWAELPPVRDGGAIVHVGSAEWACGIDLVLAVWQDSWAKAGRPLRLVFPEAEDCAVLRVAEALEASGGAWEIVRGELQPEHLMDASAVLLPWRTLRSVPLLVRVLASGRPVCLSGWSRTAALVDGSGATLPVGGRPVRLADGRVCFEPDVESLAAAVGNALAGEGAAVGARGQRHAFARFARFGRGAPVASTVPALPPRGDRPRVVLEAPFFETSSSAELSIETAVALARRGNVDLRLVPRTPLRESLAQFRRRAPELERLLTRAPGPVDLWLSSGWPVRAARPDCKSFALRVDWEYGALPTELAPHVTDEADLVIVHSDHVAETVAAAGRSRASLRVVPHGVDAVFDGAVVPDEEIVRWKAGRPAVLFCGGMVWRKGFDVFLRTVLAARAQGAEFAVVVKSIGGGSHYRGFDLRGLVDRFVATPGTPPLRLVERDLTRPELASLYAACDLMLHPYRGEGFCLPVLEARAAGLPVLATGGGATDALMAGPGARRIPSQRREVDLPGAHLGRPWVLEPCTDSATRLLVETLTDLGDHRAAARRFAPAVRAAFSWSAAAAAVERIAGQARARPSAGPGRVHERAVELVRAPASGLGACPVRQ